MLELCNFPLFGIRDDDRLMALFPVGTGLLVREPYFVDTEDCKPFHVRVSTPTDIVIYPGDAPTLRGAKWATPSLFQPPASTDEYREDAVSFMKQRQAYLAIQSFTAALAHTENQVDMVCVLVERAEANIAAARWASAYRDTSIVQTYVDMGVEVPLLVRGAALSHRAHALVGLGLLERAEEEFDRAHELLHPNRVSLKLEADPDDPRSIMERFAEAAEKQQAGAQAKQGSPSRAQLAEQRAAMVARQKRGTTQALIEAQETGELKWDELERMAAARPFACVEVGSFTGPVRVAQLKKRGGGRGVIATRDIEVGELLLGASRCRFLVASQEYAADPCDDPAVEKAFALSQRYEDRTMGWDDPRRTAAPAAIPELVVEVLPRLMDDPSVLPILESLYDGENPPKRPLVFGAMQERTVSEFASAPVDVDVAWLERICRINASVSRSVLLCARSS